MGAEKPIMKIAWHGVSTFSLEIDSTRFLFDPWITGNRNAPIMETFLEKFKPNYVLISHGHIDHLNLDDLMTILTDEIKIISSNQVLNALKKKLGINTNQQLIPIEPLNKIQIENISLKATKGCHMGTGFYGTLASLFFRNFVYCGGPSLGFIIEISDTKLYFSGDTKFSGIPREKVDIAILNIGDVLNPKLISKRLFWYPLRHKPIMDINEAITAVKRLKPKVVIPLHWDYEGFYENLNAMEFLKKVDREYKRTKVMILKPNKWHEIKK